MPPCDCTDNAHPPSGAVAVPIQSVLYFRRFVSQKRRSRAQRSLATGEVAERGRDDTDPGQRDAPGQGPKYRHAQW